MLTPIIQLCHSINELCRNVIANSCCTSVLCHGSNFGGARTHAKRKPSVQVLRFRKGTDLGPEIIVGFSIQVNKSLRVKIFAVTRIDYAYRTVLFLNAVVFGLAKHGPHNYYLI